MSIETDVYNLLLRVAYLETLEALHGFTYLETPLTSTAYNGDDTISVGTVTIDTSAVFGVPAGVKSVLLYIQAITGGGSVLAVRQVGGAQNVLALQGVTAFGHALVPTDANGDFDIVVTVANATFVQILVWGYQKR